MYTQLAKNHREVADKAKSVYHRHFLKMYQGYVKSAYAAIGEYSDEFANRIIVNKIFKNLESAAKDSIELFIEDIYPIINKLIRSEFAAFKRDLQTLSNDVWGQRKRKHIKNINTGSLEKIIIPIMMSISMSAKRFLNMVADFMKHQLAIASIRRTNISYAIKKISRRHPLSEKKKNHNFSKMRLISHMEIYNIINTVSQEFILLVNNKYPSLELKEVIINSIGDNSLPITRRSHMVIRESSKDSFFIVERQKSDSVKSVIWDMESDRYMGQSLPSHYYGKGIILPYNKDFIDSDALS